MHCVHCHRRRVYVYYAQQNIVICINNAQFSITCDVTYVQDNFYHDDLSFLWTILFTKQAISSCWKRQPMGLLLSLEDVLSLHTISCDVLRNVSTYFSFPLKAKIDNFSKRLQANVSNQQLPHNAVYVLFRRHDLAKRPEIDSNESKMSKFSSVFTLCHCWICKNVFHFLKSCPNGQSGLGQGWQPVKE